MNSSFDRFSIPAEKYLAEHNVLIYIEDAVAQLLEHKDDNPKVNSSKFFSEYFQSVREGTHVLFRDYQFIRSTAHNRASLVKMFWKCFRYAGKRGDLLSAREYHSLICLLCPDFPFELVQKTAKIILMDGAMDFLISFTDFLYAFQLQFCYDEFLFHCSKAHASIIKSTPRDTVFVPSADEGVPVHVTQTQQVNENVNHSNGVESSVFARALPPICDKFTSPPLEELKILLAISTKVSFYGFLNALAKSDQVNSSVGLLPSRDKVFDGIEEEHVEILHKRCHKYFKRSPLARPKTAGDTQVTESKPPHRPQSASSAKRYKESNFLRIAKERKQKAAPRPRPVSRSTITSSSSSNGSSSSDTDSDK